MISRGQGRAFKYKRSSVGMKVEKFILTGGSFPVAKRSGCGVFHSLLVFGVGKGRFSLRDEYELDLTLG